MTGLMRDEQAYFDRYRFDPPKAGYNKLSRRDHKIAHIGWHVGKIVGRKVPEFMVTQNRSLMVSEIIPDLAIYGTQLANLLPVPDEAFENREHRYSLSAVDFDIRRAFGAIADYIEPLEHGEFRKPNLDSAAVTLYGSAQDLALEFDVQLHEVHRQRMEDLLRSPFPNSPLHP